MLKASVLAVTVAATLALVVPAVVVRQADAATCGRACGGGSSQPSNPSNPSTPSTPSDPGIPGDPGTTPGDPGGGPGTGGNGGDLPAPPPEEQIAKLEETCNAALGTLVKIPVRMIEAFNAPGVQVVPVCNNGLGKKASIDASQAMPLQTAIGGNPALSGPLDAKGFKPDNVVGVVLKDGIATLYVHS
jgi:hypothetical protein